MTVYPTKQQQMTFVNILRNLPLGEDMGPQSPLIYMEACTSLALLLIKRSQHVSSKGLLGLDRGAWIACPPFQAIGCLEHIQ